MQGLTVVLLFVVAFSCHPVAAVSNTNTYEPAENGTSICSSAADKNGGNPIPLYNYADSGDDWKGLCANGQSQSPIDYSTDMSSMKPVPSAELIKFGSITASSAAILRMEIEEVELLAGNWTTSVQIPVCGTADIGCLASSGNTTVSYVTPKFANLHFHANSEHTRGGLYYGAEAHLVLSVTINGTSHGVVFGAWMDVSRNTTNPFFQNFEQYFDQGNGADCTPVPDNVTFAIDTLFPSNKTYYAYRGSLTTPPCTEGITWISFYNPVPMSIPQMKSIYKANAGTYQPCAPSPASAVSNNAECNILGARTNNRVLHNLNGRTIFLASPGLSGQ